MLTEGSRMAMAEALSHLLGNTSCLQRMTMCCAWNVRGPFSAEAGLLFHRQATEMFRAQGAIASRIRVMGRVAMPDESDLVLSPNDQTACRRVVDPGTLVEILVAGHERTIISIRAASDVAEDIEDRGSLVVLDLRLVAHERHLTELAGFAV